MNPGQRCEESTVIAPVAFTAKKNQVQLEENKKRSVKLGFSQSIKC